ncbi:MAG TPA: hypothetical protein VGC88_11590 [Terriglobales bacterium]|jgi:hypothetical protein
MKDPEEPLGKVVVRTDEGVIKGYCDALPYVSIADVFRSTRRSLSEVLAVRQAATQIATEIDLRDAKAVFFVKHFDGQSQRKDLRFHGPSVSNGIWVEVGFSDGECLEGIVENAVHVLLQPGFFLVPTDPGSNNRLIYVLKHAVHTFRVLGLRQF